jgi:NHS family xanthosine MFS transporter
LLKGQAFLVYAICTFGICVVLPFHSQLTPLLLAQSEVPQAFVPLLLTVAQLSELVTLATMPRVISRLGPRRTMRLGLIAAVITFVSLMIGRPLGLALTGLGCYGLIISCYLVAGQVYLNQRASDHVRSSAQALHSFLCGSGLLAGNILAGKVRAEVEGAFAPTYALSAALALGLLAVFVAGFPNDKSRDAPVE